MAVTDTKLLLVDNYDSFSYNVAHTVMSFPGSNLQIIEAGKIDLRDIDSFDEIIFSPGPNLTRSGNVLELVLSDYSGK